jgi:hypothetical protein
MANRDNILQFPDIKASPRYSEDEYSRLFLTVLLKNIAQSYHLNHKLAAQLLAPYIPGLHSLTKATIKQIRRSPKQSELANQILAESIINSFKDTGLVSC